MAEYIPKYSLIQSKRKTILLRVTDSAQVEVRAPLWTSKRRIDEFVQSKQGWIEKQLQRARMLLDARQAASQNEAGMEAQKKKLRQLAREALPRRAQELSLLMGVRYTAIRISSAQKRWGSCSARGSISLSWRLMRLPEALCDYVIIHELCHLIEMNHSKSFWREVERCLPDYRERRKALKTWQEKLLLEGW